MPLTLRVQYTFVTSSNFYSLAHLATQAVTEHSSYFGSEVSWSVLVLLHLVFLDETVMVTLLASIFIYVFLCSGVEITASFADIDTFVCIRTHGTLQLILDVQF